MIAIITFLTIIALTLITTRFAAVVLSLTGMSDTSAKFQARSALSGAGFTTSEAESIMSHPRRRKVIMRLMFIGNVGFVTLISTSILSFSHVSANYKHWPSVTIFLVGLGLLWFLATSKIVEKHLRKTMQRFVRNHTDFTRNDYENLLCLNGNFILAEFFVHKNDWLENKTLEEAKLDEEGILVLGILKSCGKYIGVPKGDTVFQHDDSITLYGHSEQLDAINKRSIGHKDEVSHIPISGD